VRGPFFPPFVIILIQYVVDDGSTGIIWVSFLSLWVVFDFQFLWELRCLVSLLLYSFFLFILLSNPLTRYPHSQRIFVLHGHTTTIRAVRVLPNRPIAITGSRGERSDSFPISLSSNF
jgi:hypothetical protein